MDFNPNIDLSKICKIWLYRIGREVYNYYLNIGRGGGRFAIRLTEDHTIEILSKVDFNPGYAYWDYDSNQNQIVLYDDNFDEKMRTEMPTILDDGMEALEIVNSGDRFITFDDLNRYNAVPPVMGGYKVAFYLDDEWRKFAVKEDIPDSPEEKYKFQPFAPIDFLTKRNYNVRPLPENTEFLDVYQNAYNYLAEHSSIKEVLIANNLEVLKQYNFDKPFNQFKLTVKASVEQPGTFDYNFLVGPRALIIEFLSALFVSMNKFELSYNGKKQDLATAFNETLEKYFKKRYQII